MQGEIIVSVGEQDAGASDVDGTWIGSSRERAWWADWVKSHRFPALKLVLLFFFLTAPLFIYTIVRKKDKREESTGKKKRRILTIWAEYDVTIGYVTSGWSPKIKRRRR